jgi:hypothetical protein
MPRFKSSTPSHEHQAGNCLVFFILHATCSLCGVSNQMPSAIGVCTPHVFIYVDDAQALLDNPDLVMKPIADRAIVGRELGVHLGTALQSQTVQQPVIRRYSAPISSSTALSVSLAAPVNGRIGRRGGPTGMPIIFNASLTTTGNVPRPNASRSGCSRS